MIPSSTDTPVNLKDVEAKLDQLIRQYQAIKDEKNPVNHQQDAWILQKTQLLEKTNLAKINVEALITRLKAMEQSA